jgi:hypothetical protein
LASWALPLYKRGSLWGLAVELNRFLKVFADQRFAKTAPLQARVIASVLEVLEIDGWCEKAAKVALLWSGAPLQRLLWLTGSVKQALQQGDRRGAYDLQIRLAALLHGAVSASNKQYVRDLDFKDLVPEQETHVDLRKYGDLRKAILVDSDEMSVNGLRAALDAARTLAQELDLLDEEQRITALLSKVT